MRGLLLALLLVAPVGAQIDAEQQHVTLSEHGLVVQWAVVGRAYNEGDLPAVLWQSPSSGGVELAELVGVVAPGSSTASGGDVPLHTNVYAADVPVAPGHGISYRVGSDGTGYAGPFTVARPPGPDASMAFAALGDIGVDATGPDGSCTADVSVSPPGLSADCPAHAIRDAILARSVDLVVIPGDLAYANSRQGWDSFMRFMTPLQATVPTMPVAGNHEYHASLGYAQFLSEYVLPGDEHRYVFQAGPVTFVGINSDAICGPHQPPTGPPQDICLGREVAAGYTEWVRQALEDASADETQWTVFFMHHPPYSYGRHGDYAGLQQLYGKWIEQYGVDVVLTSHDHLYSRSFPMRGGLATASGSEYAQGDGPIYLVTGGGGRGLYAQPAGPAPDWLAAGESVHHFVEFQVSPTTLNVTAFRIDGSVLDTFSIVQPTSAPVDSRATPALALAGIALAFIVARGIRKA